MNFIKAHSDNSTCLINLDNVEMFRGEDKDDKVGVYFADGTVGLGITESINELAAMLLPGPVIKELEPGVPERPMLKKPEPPEPETVKRAIRDLLWMVRIAAEKWHEERYGAGRDCDGCPLEHVNDGKCEAFRTLKAHDINTISRAIGKEGGDFALLTFIEAVKVHKAIEEAEPDAGSICPEDCLAADCFLRTMRGGVNRECDRHGSCEACPHNEQSVVCWFHSLTDSEIRAIVTEYERLRGLKGQEAADA